MCLYAFLWQVGAVVIAIAMNASNILAAMGDPTHFSYEEYLDSFNSEQLVADSILGSVICESLFLLLLLIPQKGKLFSVLWARAEEKVRALPLLFALLACFGVQFATTIYAMLMETFLSSFGFQYALSFTDAYAETVDQLTTPLAIVYVVLVGPILEELIFRGFVMGRLAPHGRNFAIVFSALTFGLLHMILYQVIFAFFLGVILGYVADRWSIRCSIALHIINNGVAMFLTIFEIPEIPTLGVLAGCFVATLVLILALRKDLARRVRAGKKPAAIGRGGFSSPVFITYAAITLGLGLLTVFAY